MKLASLTYLLLSASMTISCGQNVLIGKSNLPSSQNETTDTEQDPPKTLIPTPSPTPTPPSNDTQITQQVCYYSEKTLTLKNNEVCLPVHEASTDQKKMAYNYLDPHSDASFPKSFNANQYISPIRFIDLSQTSGALLISSNFRVDELMQDWKGDLALFSPIVLHYLQQMREAIDKPMILNSAYRSPGYNALVGGAKWSRHMYGDAIDFKINGTSLETLKDLCLQFGASFYQIYSGHIHCDWRNSNLDESFYGTLTPSPLEPVMVKTMAELQSSIHVDQTKETWVLSVDTDYIEDHPEDITYNWSVQLGSKRLHYSSPEIVLKKERKAYIVEVLVGESIQLRKTIPPSQR